MSTQVQIVLKQIDAVLEKVNQAGFGFKYNMNSKHPDSIVSEINQLLVSTIDRLAGPASTHIGSVRTALEKHEINNDYITPKLVGILKALRSEYEAGYMRSIAEVIHAEMFSDFLDMAEHLLDSSFKDPSAVLVGGVLEEHLRKLCIKNSLPITEADGSPKKADSMNAELSKTTVYNKLDLKSITAWLDLRNKAAHGKYNEYSKEQVVLMLQGVRDFIARTPA